MPTNVNSSYVAKWQQWDLEVSNIFAKDCGEIYFLDNYKWSNIFV